MLVRSRPTVSRVKPGLVLGLGQLGREVLELVWRRLEEFELGAETLLSYLWLDVDGGSTNESRALSSVGEWLHFQPDVLDSYRYENFPWWYPGLTHSTKRGVSRIHGRLLFLSMFDEIKRKLRSAESRSRDMGLLDSQSQPGLVLDSSQPTAVYLIGELGVLETGMIVDLVLLMKHLFGAHRVAVQGMFCLPNDCEDKYEDRRQRANVYAFLKELNWAAAQPRSIEVDWIPGSRYTVSPPLFETGLFFEPSSSLPSELAEHIAQDYCPGAFADYRRSIRVNLAQLSPLSGESSLGQASRFGRARLASVRIGHQRFQQGCAARLAGKILEFWSSGNTPSESEVVKLVDRQRILPDLDTLVAGLLDPEGGGSQERGRTDGLERKLRDQYEDAFERVRAADYQPEALVEQARRLASLLEPKAPFGSTIQANRAAWAERLEKRLEALFSHLLERERVSVVTIQQVFDRVRDLLTVKSRKIGRELDRLKELFRTGTATSQQTLVALAHVAKGWKVWGHESRLARISKDFLLQSVALEEPLGTVQIALRERVLEGLLGLMGQLRDFIDGDTRSRGTDSLSQRLSLVRSYLGEMASEFELSSRELLHDPDGPIVALLSSQDLERVFGHYVRGPEELELAAEEVLSLLDVSPTSLPNLKAEGSLESWKLQLLELCRRRFHSLDKDFHVLRQFFEQTEQEQRAAVEDFAARCHLPLYTDNSELSRRLRSQNTHTFVALPAEGGGRSVSEGAELREYLERIRELVRVSFPETVHFVELEGCSQILVYSESGGLPLSHLVDVEGMREDYELLFAAGESLHLDSRFEDYTELSVVTAAEVRILEEASRALVLGQLLGLVDVRQGEFFWTRRQGLFERRFPLGNHSRILARLREDGSRRQRILGDVQQHLEAIYKESEESLLRLAWLLSRAKERAYGDSWGKVFETDELPLTQRLQVLVLNQEEERLRRLPYFREIAGAQLERMIEQVTAQAKEFADVNGAGWPVLKSRNVLS